MFRPPLQTTARWRPLAGDGLEHLTITPHNTAAGTMIRASSVIIGGRGGNPYGVSYRIDCASDWTVLSFSIETTDGIGVALVSDGAGHWHTQSGTHLAPFDGCIDIDLAGTPFTNTLPIRRLNLTPSSGTVSLSMLYIPFDTFEPRRDYQRYTCISPQKLFRYEAQDRSFAADLPVDEDGLVLDYPTLFSRLAV